MKKGIFTGLVAAMMFASVCLAGCGETACEHKLQAVAHKDATCAETGNIAYYRCEKCDAVFFDENGGIELTEESVVIGKLPHSIEHYAAVEGDGMNRPRREYWHCFACGKYYADASLQTEITYSELFAGAYDPVRLTDVDTSGNMYVSSSTMPAIRDDFTFRCFIGWQNGTTRLDAQTKDTFPNGKVQININLNRECTLSQTGWYNFGVGYNAKEGLYFKKLQSVDSVAAPEKFTQLFLEQGGIYVIVVRQGTNVTFYFEDENGEPQRMNSHDGFGTTDALIRLAANPAESVEGWRAVVTKAAICVGVSDPKCVFDKAYEND